MGEDVKPFSCTIKGCQMTFVNEDHLNWHKKKHDMILNLGSANKNCDSNADQTPTPTRFIRNCEEVGLFQDLQNVNPFDETFKKAIEFTANVGSLNILNITSDDSLNTPHIFPPVEDNSDKFTNTDHSQLHTTDFCIIQTDVLDNNSGDSKQILIENNLKNKLKETIINKERCKNASVKSFPEIQNPQINSNDQNNYNDKDNKKKRPVNNKVMLEKIREMNRAAQLRCRKRKKNQWNRMEEELDRLKFENQKVLLENGNFKNKFNQLKKLITEQKRSSTLTKAQILMGLEGILNSSSSVVVPTVKSRRVLKPAKEVLTTNNAPMSSEVGAPILIQLVGSVSQLAVAVLPTPE